MHSVPSAVERLRTKVLRSPTNFSVGLTVNVGGDHSWEALWPVELKRVEETGPQNSQSSTHLFISKGAEEIGAETSNPRRLPLMLHSLNRLREFFVWL